MNSATTRRKNSNRSGPRSGRRNLSHRAPVGEGPHFLPKAESEYDLGRQPTLRLAAWRTNRITQFIRPLIRTGAAILVSLLICFLLAQIGVAHAINDEMSALGFDSDRALFLQYVLMALLGGLVSGFLLRWRLAAWLGALFYYIAWFFIPYMSRALNPVATADGRPQFLIPGAFIQNSVALMSIGVIAAGAGAVLGQTCGDILISPMAVLARYVWARAKPHKADHSSDMPDLRRVAPALALMVLLVVAMVFAVRNVGDILSYGTSAAIYQPIQVTVAHGTVNTIDYRSPALGGRMRQFLIYLPPTYADTPVQRYPVIYLLHGTPGGMVDWFKGAHVDETANDLIADGRISDVILVSPDGNGPIYKASEWANSFNGRQRMEDSIAQDLVTYVDTHYRTIANPAGRTLAGLSDGGFGATNIALHHPNVFGSVLTLGGFYWADRSPVFGSGPPGDQAHRYNSPAAYVTTMQGRTAARSIHFIVGVATHDRGYFTEGMSFYNELKQLDVHVDLISVTGDHSWRTWGTQFAQALPLLEAPLVSTPRPHGR